MNQSHKGGLIGKTRKMLDYLAGLHIPSHAANAGYFIVLSLFPALVLLMGILRWAGLNADHFADLLDGLIPDVLIPYAKRLIQLTYQNTTGAVVSVSAAVALWSASRGIHGLLTGLRQVYRVEHQPSWLKSRLISLMYTFILLLLLILTLVAQVFGHRLENMLPLNAPPFFEFLGGVLDLRFILLPLLQTALFAALFYILPETKNPFRFTLPGAMLASFGWLTFTKVYSLYVSFSAGYATIYGPVYMVALSMLWLFFCLSILFYGAALNVYLLDRRK